MSYRQKLPMVALALIAWTAGAWIMLSPWVLSWQNRMAPWRTVTTVHFWTGMAIILIALLQGVALLPRRPHQNQPNIGHHPDSANAESGLLVGAGPEGSEDDMLLSLATALLREISLKPKENEEDSSR